MPNKSDAKNVAIVTTSWDDGHPLDISLAEALASYNLLGTFYIPLVGVTMDKREKVKLPIMDMNMIRSIKKMGMEIGSHTSTHRILTNQSSDIVINELVGSKKVLEDIVEEPVTSFCYPNGKFNRFVRSKAIKAGYRLARTTIAFRMGRDFDPFCMPVSFQFFAHTYNCHIRHAMKEANVKGLLEWYRFLQMENDPVKLAELTLQYILEHGGILHIWGHSWEIEQFGLWGALEEAFKRIANRPGVLYLTNAQVLEVIEQ
jgi:peptidoglycan-N-acetylglucosamine deacetylase